MAQASIPMRDLATMFKLLDRAAALLTSGPQYDDERSILAGQIETFLADSGPTNQEQAP